jgi:uncharacterized membrane protein YkoI
MKRKILIGTISGALILGGAIAVGAAEDKGEQVMESKEVIQVQPNNTESNKQPANNVTNALNTNKINQEATISKEKAIQIAEKEVNGKMYSIEKEFDDGVLQYDVELNKDGKEANVEIDAMTGNILEVDIDDDDFDDIDNFDDDDRI